jgi:hypothetical protein
MNEYQSITSGQGLLKDYYDEGQSPLEKALAKRRKKRRQSGMDEESLSDEDKLLEDQQGE